MTAIVLALMTSAGYGLSDYLAGRVARRLDAALLVLCSQTAQVGVVLILSVGRPASIDDLSWGLAAGVVNAVGFVLYYQALAQGPAALVAPLAATSPILPVALSAARGDSLHSLAYGGLLAVVIGVAATASAAGDATDTAPSACRGAIRLRKSDRQRFWRPYPCVVLAFSATVVFGCSLLILDIASKRSAPDLLWVAAGLQLGALPPPLVRLWTARAQVHAPARADLPPIAVIAGSNLAADIAIAHALAIGHLGIVSVLSSLGPVLTVALARLHDGERPTTRQLIGGLVTLSGVCLTTYGIAQGQTR